MQLLKTLLVLGLCIAVAPGKIIKVEVKDENKKVCLIAEMEASVVVSYEKKDNSTATQTIEVTQPAGEIPGKCPSVNDTKAQFELVFDGEYTLTFMFDQKTKTAYMTNVQFNYTLDPAKFPDAKTPKAKVTDEGIDEVALSPVDQYFSCKSGVKVPFKNSKDVVQLSDLKIQVYNVNGTYSKEGTQCAGDQTTVAPPVTTPPPKPTPTSSPTPPPTPETGDWSVPGPNNTICILLQMGARFEIVYLTKDKKNHTATVDLPIDATSEGTCGKLTDTITLKFFKDWSLELIFEEMSSAMLKAGKTGEYALNNVTLTYVQDDPKIFINPIETGKKVALVNGLGQFKTSVNNSYTCVSKTEINLSNGIKFDTFNMTAQAFKTDNSTTFTGSNQSCPADANNGTSNIVPIAVGIALAVLVVIVLIAYIIGRRRSKSSYETV